MTTLQIRIDDNIKKNSDILFAELGLDTPTAVRMFLSAALECEGFPFPIGRKRCTAESMTAIEDARLHRNLHGPYSSGKEAVAAMLEE